MSIFETLKHAISAKPAVTPPSRAGEQSKTNRVENAHSPITAPQGERRILYVSANFAQFQAELKQLQPTWFIGHAPDGVAALEYLRKTSFDALVLSSEVAGAEQFLATYGREYPRVPRILVTQDRQSATADPNLESIEYVSPDAPTETVAETLARIFQVQAWMSTPAMKQLLGRIQKLPTLPRLYSQVTSELQSPEGSLEVASQFIRKDPIMSAKFLQVANSASLGLSYIVSDPGEAVILLGAERTRSMILMGSVFSQFENIPCPGFSSERIWDHSMQTASLAHGITLVETEDPKLAELAFTAGLLHDIGKLMLAANLPDMYATIQQLESNKKVPLCEAETTILGTTHAELGACLLGNWRLPLAIVQAVAWHHQPMRSTDRGFTVLTAVHAANVFAQDMGSGCDDAAAKARIDLSYLVRTGLGGRTKLWREACGVPLKEEEAHPDEQIRQRTEAKHN